MWRVTTTARGRHSLHIVTLTNLLRFSNLPALFCVQSSQHLHKTLFVSQQQHTDLQWHVQDLVGLRPPDTPQQLLKIGNESHSRTCEDINRQWWKNEDKKVCAPSGCSHLVSAFLSVSAWSSADWDTDTVQPLIYINLSLIYYCILVL